MPEVQRNGRSYDAKTGEAVNVRGEREETERDMYDQYGNLIESQKERDREMLRLLRITLERTKGAAE